MDLILLTNSLIIIGLLIQFLGVFLKKPFTIISGQILPLISGLIFANIAEYTAWFLIFFVLSVVLLFVIIAQFKIILREKGFYNPSS